MAPNISQLSRAVKKKPAAPWVLRTYFAASHVSLINANLNPDVPRSAQMIESMYHSAPGQPSIDGIVFVDSWLADSILGALGPVTTDGRTFNAQNLNVGMEYMAEQRHVPASIRMLFLSHIANVLVQRFKGSSSAQRQLLPILMQQLRDKHILIYANNAGLERWLARRNWGGALPRYRHVNSLLVVNDNYGGLKDNYFLNTHLIVRLHHLKSGTWQERVTTTWTMNGVRDGWMVGTYVGWVECYVPRGTKLTALIGYHVHGVRRMDPGMDRTAYGTGILIAPRKSDQAPPNVRTLTWIFNLPALSHPATVHIEIQPGLPVQILTYGANNGRLLTMRQTSDVTLHIP
jgi:hypothetical protein